MQESQIAELLSSELADLIRDERVAAEVRVAPAMDQKGPFVEVRPTVASTAPEMSIHVLSPDSVALTIGGTASADWEGDSESIVETVRSLAIAVFRGHLSEEVTLNRQRQVLASRLLVTQDGEQRVIWKRSSLLAQLGSRSKTREVTEFPRYPRAAD